MSDPIHRHSPGTPDVRGIYHAATGSVQYLCACPATRDAVLIDPVQDYDPAAGRTGFGAAAHLLTLAQAEGLRITHVIDTHPHADHFSAAAWIAAQTGARTATTAGAVRIADLWAGFYGLLDTHPGAFDPARDWDMLLAEGDTLRIGQLDLRIWASPGHTLGSISLLAGDAAFIHDTLMHVDVGTARCDFPGGSAADLWDSLQRILGLPDATRLFVGHDYGAAGRDGPAWEASVADHRARNPHLAGQDRAGFLALRQARDASLALPDRMLAALQVNLRAGRLPPPEPDGHRYLRIPLDRF